MRDPTLKVLLVDDDEDDYIITRDLLKEIPSFDVELDWARDFGEAMKQISGRVHSIYLIDYRLGSRTGLELVKEAIKNGCRDPFIMMTGHGDRDIDLEAMKSGAADYIVKGRLDADILDRAIRYAMERRSAEIVKDELISDLRDAAKEIRTLNGMLPICASCKRIRDDGGYWNQLEKYLEEHSNAELSHSICPTCARQLYPGLRDGLISNTKDKSAVLAEDADV